MAVNGLPNVGLTCYSNAVFQSLYHLRDFRELILNAELSDKQTFIFYFKEIFALLNDSADSERMKIICQVFKSYCDKFNLYQQDDANHFITYILNRLESEMNFYSKCNQNKVSDLFRGVQEDRITCENCNKDDTINQQKFYTYSITPDSNKTSTIENLFMKSFAYGAIEDSYCNHCQKPLMKHTYIKRWPKYLIINLCRGQQGQQIGKLRKVETAVLIPNLQLTLANNCNLYTDDGSDSGNVEYKLVAVINHFGTAYSGHYTCISHTEFSWLEFNDSKITPVEESSVITKDNNILLFQQQLQLEQTPPEEQPESQLEDSESKEQTAPELKTSLPEQQQESQLEQKLPEEQLESQTEQSGSEKQLEPEFEKSQTKQQQEMQLEQSLPEKQLESQLEQSLQEKQQKSQLEEEEQLQQEPPPKQEQK